MAILISSIIQSRLSTVWFIRAINLSFSTLLPATSSRGYTAENVYLTARFHCRLSRFLILSLSISLYIYKYIYLYISLSPLLRISVPIALA